jgi:prepilin-type N-terminal cleavage/methylation domain-containing protein
MPPRPRAGFTLVELSIVLVVIGLLVGGVMVGRDLIKAAEIRAQVSQFEKFNSAVNTFRNKYGGLPGDLKYTEARAYGLYSITYAPYVGLSTRGDGNGLIQSRGQNYFTDELVIFWRHLSEAGLIDGIYGLKLNTAAETTTNFVNDYLPTAKIGQNAVIQIGTAGTSTNYYLILSTSVTAGGCCNAASQNTVTAYDSYQIDSKIDDALPGSGSVFAVNALSNVTLNTTWTTVSAASGCVSSGAYSLNPGTTPDCSLRFRFQY